MLPHKDTILGKCLTQFHRKRKVKQNKKAEELASIEKARKKELKKKKEIKINNLPNKEIKALVTRMLSELEKTID